MILIVKSSPAFYIGMSVLVTGLLAGCGQTGALYMPKIPGKPVPAKATDNSSAAPAAPVTVPLNTPMASDPAMSTQSLPTPAPVPATATPE